MVRIVAVAKTLASGIFETHSDEIIFDATCSINPCTGLLSDEPESTEQMLREMARRARQPLGGHSQHEGWVLLPGNEARGDSMSHRTGSTPGSTDAVEASRLAGRPPFMTRHAGAASTSCFFDAAKTWMAGTSPATT
jgi:hypothetical protein